MSWVVDVFSIGSFWMMLLQSSGSILEADQVSSNFACDVPKSSRNPETYDNRIHHHHHLCQSAFIHLRWQYHTLYIRTLNYYLVPLPPKKTDLSDPSWPTLFLFPLLFTFASFSLALSAQQGSRGSFRCPVLSGCSLRCRGFGKSGCLGGLKFRNW